MAIVDSDADLTLLCLELELVEIAFGIKTKDVPFDLRMTSGPPP